ncbi:hypothetical protein KL1_00055 [Burkholderia phage vB_BceS_KL1]|jgi:hypothetical protein|uniref:Uncharacterized protein n=1 Tax=Burkholderia phage vB_BceS_KL1 TaxID=1132026 RepID=I6NQV4_9CAUD|nr:hypothetical protein B612_gp55 [Burkholderia phage vB_BceS_KL1]AEX56125.1 hypothetical protein KL1_00055 [Burkholderia phage vB_BceS_KL1]
MALNKKQTAAFAALSAAIAASAEGFIYAAAGDVAPFVAAGLVETNETIKDENGNIAVRLKPETEGTSNVNTATNTAAPVAASAFAIEDGVPLPSGSGRGRTGTTYPFDALNVGQSFFVPNSEDKPNAAKSLASTVSSATARYAQPSPDGATKTNKKGETVPVMVETRKFVVRAVEGGARVWRTK